MKIYFAGSVRGGRSDAQLYHDIIACLKRDHEVLTEHIGDVALNSVEGPRDVMIYRQDMAWLQEADMLVGECTCPSLGVGYELARAQALGVPCHLFYNAEKTQLSAMLTGAQYFHIHPYRQKEEVFAVLGEILAR